MKEGKGEMYVYVHGQICPHFCYLIAFITLFWSISYAIRMQNSISTQLSLVSTADLPIDVRNLS